MCLINTHYIVEKYTQFNTIMFTQQVSALATKTDYGRCYVTTKQDATMRYEKCLRSS